MTYTFKLARRLAVSRDYAMLAAMLLVAACAGESTAPETGPAIPKTASALHVTPRRVTLEPRQKITFKGLLRTSTGDSVTTPVSWVASGGTIGVDGSYTAGEPGTYKVVGRGRGWKRADTSIVVVVAPQPDLVSISVTPESVSLAAGASRTFAATGHLSDGTTAAVGVTWTATGGTIDAGGVYTAGQAGGAFRVVATHTGGTFADTASVSVAAAAPSPAPTLAQVIMSPASASLLTGGTQQFKAYGRLSTGDSVAVTVTYAATGGTVTSGGLYTAGGSAGSFRVIAAASGIADTASVAVSVPPPPPTSGAGLPFGPFHFPQDQYASRTWYDGALKAIYLSSFESELAAAKAAGVRVFVSLPDSRTYYTNSDKTFSLTLWKQQMDRWRPYVAALERYYADGVILGNYLVDEPDCVPCWGGKRIAYADVEEMGRYAKTFLPSIPTTVRVTPGWLRGASFTWRYIDIAWAQWEGPLHYPSANMTPTQFRDKNVADAKALGMGLVLGMNTLDGGDGSSRINGTFAQDPNLSDTPSGSYRYQMSAAEVEKVGTVLAAEPYTCALIDWRYSLTTSYASSIKDFDNRSDVKAALSKIASVANARSAPRCQ